MPVIPFNRYRNYFDDDTTLAMGEAYEAACAALDSQERAVVREALAKRILHAARMGERNSRRLCDIALAGLISPES